jgi:hypothetical protein
MASVASRLAVQARSYASSDRCTGSLGARYIADQATNILVKELATMLELPTSPTSSQTANPREPLCYTPFSQVAADRRCGRETLS